ncbi:hypothetical protein M422DRAFT_262538 [Sphaerobolus stellatus SS14]|uniref:Uncharacterized protein n=1 Tax=Sphaerobolus stellatus (strain SS14) TaxID=990650 RepID=A0A0C9UJW5_SPHS4|nr:hypothetical protein M422DRAFT_262538 [Sphaerobolus stellatus SS14]
MAEHPLLAMRVQSLLILSGRIADEDPEKTLILIPRCIRPHLQQARFEDIAGIVSVDRELGYFRMILEAIARMKKLRHFESNKATKLLSTREPFYILQDLFCYIAK